MTDALTDEDIDEILQIMDHIKVRARVGTGTGKRKRPSFAALGPEERLNLKATINQAWTRERHRQEKNRHYATYKEVKRIERLQKAAGALLSALNEVGPDVFVYWSDNAPESKFRAALLFAEKIEKMSAVAVTDQRLQLGKTDSSSHPFWFIYELSKHYEKTFAQRPTATLGGSWEVFLREVLARCKGKPPLSVERIHALWLSVAALV